MNKAQLKQKILDVIKGMSESERVAIYQKGCDCYNYVDDMIFPMDKFDEREGKRSFSEVYEHIDAHDFSFNDDYYYLDGCAYYRSFSNIMDSYCAYVLDDLIDYAIDDEYDFGSPKIAKVFEEVRSEEK